MPLGRRSCGTLRSNSEGELRCSVRQMEEAEQEWVQEIIKMSRLSESFQAECTPGYYNNEGKPNPKSVQNGSYGAGPVKFFKVIEGWREEGTLAGLELR